MADSLTKSRRSWNMSRIKGKDTGPEKIVRSLLHRMGFRFSLHKSTLPGKPDLVMPKHQTVVFVHGCFWHRHKGCKGATMPKSRTEWWRVKLEGNAARDQRNQTELRRTGWRVLTVWECETANREKLSNRLEKLFSASFSFKD
jgi:DNA mismatch endonuclease (patch repair protein)